MVDMWARLAKRVTPRMAEQELGVLTDELRKRSPAAVWDKERIISEPGGYLQVLHNDTLPMVGLVTALVLLILAVACSNLGGLLLARGVTRAHEISIRVALGASRWRVVRQLFTESLLLAAIAAVAGLGLGYTCLRTFMAQFDAAPWLDPMPDWREIAFAAVVGLLAAIFFGLAPAMQLTGKRRQSIRARQVLVMAQIAASCILLIVAGLLVRALNHALSTDPGYDYRHTLVIDPDLAAHGYTASGSQHYLDAVQQKLRELPGLASVGVSSMAPLGHKNVTGISGHSYNIFVSRIEPGFFETMQIPRQSGRDVSRTDTNEIVASESMAQHEWPGQNPLGKQFVVEPTNPASERLTVVGVVANARTMSMHDPDSVEMYQMARPQDLAHMVVLVRTAGAPEDIAAMARGVASSIDPALFPNVRLLRDSFHDEVGTVERGAVIAGLMGTTAMLLAVVGIVGLVAYAVSQKTQEIAIRLALGAGKRHVVTTMLRQFFVPVALGLVVGAALSAAVSHLLRRILYGVSGLDPASYAGAIGLLATMATIAALWPARRAVRIDPMRVLRHE
jgi:predicted permease